MSNDLAVRQKSELQAYLESNMSKLAACCPKHFTPEAMIQVACILVHKTPDLLRCTPNSVLNSMVEAGSFGFSLNPKQGECYLIPRKNKDTGHLECTLDIGYRGLAKLVRGNGKVEYVVAHVVHANDHFKVRLSPDPVIEHEPLLGKDRGPVTYVYSMVKFLTGSTIYDYMSKDDVEKIRRTSQKPNGTFWVNYWDEMSKKTVMKRHCKSLDQTPELARAIEIDNEEYQEPDDQNAKPTAVTNGTGFGSGKYAAPEDQASYLTAIEGYLEKRNSTWLDRWTKKGGEIPEKLTPHLSTIAQADDYIVKYCESVGMIAPGSRPEGGIKHAQIGRLAAIPFVRSTEECNKIKRELKSFLDRQEAIATEALQKNHPELFKSESDDNKGDAWEEGAPK